MKHILAILLIATTIQAEELWVSGTRANWINRRDGIMYRLTELIDIQTTNTCYTTSGVPYQVTNFTHTAENTNNVKWQFNFSYEKGTKDIWIWGYDTRKIGGWDIANEWVRMKAYCNNVSGMECRKGVGLQEYKTLKGITATTNTWKTLNIPFVDDAKKVQKRKSEYRRKKK